MMGTTHQLIALLSAFWILTLYPTSVGPTVGVLAVVAVMVGALTPDLDQPTANIWRRMLGGRAIGNVFQAFSGGHRHLTHSIVGIAAIGWALRWLALNIINPEYTEQALFIWVAFMVGYISHPIADSFTDQGVPWFWPFHMHVKIPPGPEELRVTTNSIVERVFVRGGILIIAVLLIQPHWHVLVQFFT
jgi:membrane-bound metal-dependent hydrolase YbcI (DUF457 family)